jgi:hypothetical protein
MAIVITVAAEVSMRQTVMRSETDMGKTDGLLQGFGGRRRGPLLEALQTHPRDAESTVLTLFDADVVVHPVEPNMAESLPNCI